MGCCAVCVALIALEMYRECAYSYVHFSWSGLSFTKFHKGLHKPHEFKNRRAEVYESRARPYEHAAQNTRGVNDLYDAAPTPTVKGAELRAPRSALPRWPGPRGSTRLL